MEQTGEFEWKKNKKKEKKRKEKKRKVKRGEKGHFWQEQALSEREGGEERFRERNSTFSLRSMQLRPWVFFGVRVKVDPSNEGYACVPNSGRFVKLQEVGNFPTWIIFSLKSI